MPFFSFSILFAFVGGDSTGDKAKTKDDNTNGQRLQQENDGDGGAKRRTTRQSWLPLHSLPAWSHVHLVQRSIFSEHKHEADCLGNRSRLQFLSSCTWFEIPRTRPTNRKNFFRVVSSLGSNFLQQCTLQATWRFANPRTGSGVQSSY